MTKLLTLALCPQTAESKGSDLQIKQVGAAEIRKDQILNSASLLAARGQCKPISEEHH